MDKKIIIHGRVLGYAEYGDPKGKPVFFFHGWPSSRLQAAAYDLLAKRLHLRIIAPDRPGYGLSGFQKNRRLLDWPDDVVALADKLKIQKFAVMGVSGGGPYAAVCAYKIPNRLTHAAIVVGLSPIVGWESFDGVVWIGKIGWANFPRYPWLRTVAALLQYCMTRYGLRLGLYRFLFNANKDRKLMDDPSVRDRVRRNTLEAFRQGWQGAAHDLTLYSIDWGFAVSDIRISVTLWYGDADQNVSLTMGKYYATNIPKNTFQVYKGEGHMVALTHAAEILRSLA